MNAIQDSGQEVSETISDAYSHAVVNANQFVVWHSQITTDMLPEGIAITDLDRLEQDLNLAVEQICKEYGF